MTFLKVCPFWCSPEGDKNHVDDSACICRLDNPLFLMIVPVFVGWIILCLSSKLVAGKCSGLFVGRT
jgi:hypothetical protein